MKSRPAITSCYDEHRFGASSLFTVRRLTAHIICTPPIPHSVTHNYSSSRQADLLCGASSGQDCKDLGRYKLEADGEIAQEPEY